MAAIALPKRPIPISATSLGMTMDPMSRAIQSMSSDIQHSLIRL